MFDPHPCSVTDCAGSALTGLAVCSSHCEDVDAYAKKIRELLLEERRLSDYDISGITLSDIDLSAVHFSGCNLSEIHLERVTLKKAIFHLVFCDSAGIVGSDFSGSNIKNSVFAGSLIEDSLFSDCDILQCSFLGVRCRAVVFDHSNLYSSRFLGGSFQEVGMKDCNLTRARFNRNVSGVDFRSSNTNEASFVEGGE